MVAVLKNLPAEDPWHSLHLPGKASGTEVAAVAVHWCAQQNPSLWQQNHILLSDAIWPTEVGASVKDIVMRNAPQHASHRWSGIISAHSNADTSKEKCPLY